MTQMLSFWREFQETEYLETFICLAPSIWRSQKLGFKKLSFSPTQNSASRDARKEVLFEKLTASGGSF